MAAFNRLQIGLERIGGATTIPNNPKARLMYYIDCICQVINVDDGSLQRLRNYSNYWLSGLETDQLLVTAALLDPRPLMNKVIFQDDRMCGDNANQFYNINAVNNTLAVVDGLVIGGVRRRTTSIMCFKMNWLNRNYLNPLQQVLLERRAEQARARQTAQSCTIL